MLSQLKENISGKRSDDIEKQISGIKKEQEENTAKILDSLKQFEESIIAVRSEHKQLIEESRAANESVAKLKSETEESIASVKMISSAIQSTLSRKITDEMHSMTQEISGKLSIGERLKKEMEESMLQIRDELKQLCAETAKLKTVSSGIKQQDFELVKFAEKLKAVEDEKLGLIRQVDSLQRLVSSLRRKMH